MATLALVTLDHDDTLWDIEQVVAHAERRVHGWFADHHPRVAERFAPADLRRLRDEAERDHPELAVDLTALRRRSLAVALQSAGYDPDHHEAAFDAFWAARHEVELFADVLPALALLRSRFRLAAITNGNADLARIGLAGYFEFTLTATEAGIAKPAAEIFHAACARAGVAPDAALHAGDDPELDVLGARRAGLATAWVNRNGLPWPHPAERPDHEVADLRELAARLLAAP